MKPTTYASGRPAPTDSPFELFAWFFMRVSGIVLLFLAVGHMLIMHVINNIDNLSYQFVAVRWSTPFWRTYDGIMLVLAMFHGLNGLRVILDDFLRPGGWRVFWMSLMYMTGFIFLVLGLVVLLTFRPSF